MWVKCKYTYFVFFCCFCRHFGFLFLLFYQIIILFAQAGDIWLLYNLYENNTHLIQCNFFCRQKSNEYIDKRQQWLTNDGRNELSTSFSLKWRRQQMQNGEQFRDSFKTTKEGKILNVQYSKLRMADSSFLKYLNRFSFVVVFI